MRKSHHILKNMLLSALLLAMLLGNTLIPGQAGASPLPGSPMEPASIPVTRWVSPGNEQPMSYTEWHSQQAQGPWEIKGEGVLRAEKGGTRAISILINDLLYSYVRPEFERFLSDLQQDGYTVYWSLVSKGTPKEVRDHLRSQFTNLGIEGALLVGDLPVPWFEMDDDFDETHAEFPVDLYFMDLDGQWVDTDNDGLFNTHSAGKGSVAPEIYVTRLTGNTLAAGDLPLEAQLMQNYFRRNHLYRTFYFYNWREISDTGTRVQPGSNGYTEVPLPFPFTFYGSTYNSVFISEDGFISFGQGYSSPTNVCLPDGSAPSNAVFAFWDDLDLAASENGSITHATLDEDTFVIEWSQVAHKDSATTETFEILLHKDGLASLQYQVVGDTASMTAGIQDGNQRATLLACSGGIPAGAESLRGGGTPVASGMVQVFTPEESYTTSQGSYEWLDISTTGTALNLSDYNAVSVDLPAPFPFYNNLYSSVYVNTNGFISFGNPGSQVDNVCLPNSNAPSNAIYAFWDRLSPGADGKVYAGAFDDDRFVIQWQNVKHYGSNLPESFEIILYRNGEIQLQYHTVSNASSATVGIERDNSGRSLPYACNSMGGAVVSGLALHYQPLPYAMPQQFGMAYIDDDWADYFGGWEGHEMSRMYGANVDVVWKYTPTNTTTRNNYLEHSGAAPQFAHVMSHGYPQGHGFKEAYDNFDFVFSSDIQMYNPPASFYNLFVCSGARYVESDYLAGNYLLDPYKGANPYPASGAGLIVVGSTKTGSMLSFDYFYEPLGRGNTFGQSYLDWFNFIAQGGFDLGERQWHYGMTLLGDPTLRLDYSQYGAPSLQALDPPHRLAGNAPLTLHLNGFNFMEGSRARWNGVDLDTHFISSTKLRAIVPAEMLVTPGSAYVSVYSPVGSGVESNGLTFTIDAPQLSLSPSSAIAGGPAFDLIATGLVFNPGAYVLWSEQPLTTTYINSSQVIARVPAEETALGGLVDVSVFNPGTGASQPVTFTITYPLPNPSEISPSVVTAGGASFTLQIDGQSFFSTSVVQWDGEDLPTRFIHSGRLEADVPAKKITATGTASITVTNPAPGGGTSPARVLDIHNPRPAISTLNPSQVLVGSPDFTLQIHGAGFLEGSGVRWNGLDLPTTYLSSTVVEAEVSANQIATSGTISLTVFNPGPGGGVSDIISFTIQNPAPHLASLNSESAVVGEAFTLVLNGSSFVEGTVVRWNGIDLVTRWISPTRLEADVPASLTSIPGMASVTVYSPGPGGGESNALSFEILGGRLFLPLMRR